MHYFQLFSGAEKPLRVNTFMTNNSIQPSFFQSLGIPEPAPEELTPIPPSSGVETDFESSRKNLIRMMETTMGAIKSLSVIAHQSQMPDAYDVLNKLIKTYNEQQEQLIRFYRIKESKESAPTKQTPTNQNLFIGSPKDLADVLDKMNKNG